MHRKPLEIQKWIFPSILAIGVLAQWQLSLNHQPATLFTGITLYAVAIFLGIWALKSETALSPGKPLSLAVECVLLGFILLLAIFLRVYHLDQIPQGIYLDSSGPAYLALKVLHENWKPPFMLPSFAANPSYLVYLLSFWFREAPNSQEGLFLFFVFFSIASFPLIYWTFRQLSGPRVALLTLYFIAIMRWDMVFSRIGFRGIQVPFYMFGTLAFLIYGFKNNKKWAFPISALFLSAGLYTYQSFKVFPLLVMVLVLYECRRNPLGIKALRGTLGVSVLLTMVLVFPLLHYWMQQGTIGTRESELFIGKEIVQQKSLKPLMEKITATALMFNRQGETQPRHNYKDERWLDDLTGLFFIFGLFYALFNIKERSYFYALSGFGIMSLPGLLSSEATQAQRMLGDIPYVAFFSASAFYLWQGAVRRAFPQWKLGIQTLLLGLLLFAAVENIKIYFWDQAQDKDCAASYSLEATTVGKWILSRPDTAFYLVPSLYEHYTVRFLDYFQSDRIHPFIPGLLRGQWLDPSKPKVGFVLEEGKGPTLDFLREIYPAGREEEFEFGKARVYFYFIPQSSKTLFTYSKGLKGTFYTSGSMARKPFETRWDPLINFTSLGDMGISHPPFKARWTGKILLPRKGPYEFTLLSTDGGRLMLDGKQIVDAAKGNSGFLQGQKGWHSIEIDCQRDNNPDVSLDLHLLWKKPGEDHSQVIPMDAFGPVQDKN